MLEEEFRKAELGEGVKAAFQKRGRIEIIHEILSFCREPAQKTNILHKCNLSYEQLRRYTEYLTLNGLLSSFKERQREFFHVTDKGKRFLEEYESLGNFIRENV